LPLLTLCIITSCSHTLAAATPKRRGFGMERFREVNLLFIVPWLRTFSQYTDGNHGTPTNI
jgi:hypothetical protein